MQSVVVWDPEGTYSDGSLVSPEQAMVLESRGVALLPVEPELFRRAGVSGYMRRGWGAGWPLDYSAPRLVCPLTLFLVAGEKTKINWVIRLMPAQNMLDEKNHAKTSGTLTLTGDNTVGGGALQIQPESKLFDASQLGAIDEFGGWTTKGRGRVMIPGDGYYAFGLYGALPGIRVAWAALTQTK